MLTDLSITTAKKLARGKRRKFSDFSLIMARVDLVGYRFSFLVRTRLAEAEKKRLNSLRNEKRRREWLAGRIAAKEAVFRMAAGGRDSAFFFCDYGSLVIGQSRTGRPCIQSESKRQRDLSVSISHSYGLAIAMASAGHCGVDLQKIDSALDRIQKYFVNKSEKKLLISLSGSLYNKPRQGLALLWSAKEALKKQGGWSPMPGFRDFELVDIQFAEIPVFTLALPVKNREDHLFEKVAVSIYGGYSLAFTLPYCSKTNS
ncbi:MAG: 4'-phosphopantetheinyl transferase superfamily protein [Thermodesulfobacteriota bacterium]